jgi:phytanoyl-CoA hydroxylase
MTRLDDFQRQGFALLPGFNAATDIDAAAREIETCFSSRSDDVVVDLLDTNERTLYSKLSEQQIKTGAMKVNDLHLLVPNIRNLALSDKLVPILREFLGQVPALCVSLFFQKGSAQPPHVDSIFMTPRTPGHLIATWMALEDVDADAGPLEYFPGSHVIEPYVFSTGLRHFVADELPQWSDYYEKQVKERELKKVKFEAKKGDVFIWHSDLLHGGSTIRNPSLTRKSFVFHYYSEFDCRAMGNDLVEKSGGYWVKRDRQRLPSEK